LFDEGERKGGGGDVGEDVDAGVGEPGVLSTNAMAGRGVIARSYQTTSRLRQVAVVFVTSQKPDTGLQKKMALQNDQEA
jgi:hypothetical protein